MLKRLCVKLEFATDFTKPGLLQARSFFYEQFSVVFHGSISKVILAWCEGDFGNDTCAWTANNVSAQPFVAEPLSCNFIMHEIRWSC